MPAITFVRPGESTWVQRDQDSEHTASIIPRTNRTQVHLQGSDTRPHLFEPGFAPNTGPAPHAHAVDEVFYILEGELRFGRQVYPAGSTIFIPALTLYSFTAGDDGCRFLNFRARLDPRTYTPAELVEILRDHSQPNETNEEQP